MADDEKNFFWGIHTKDDNMFLRNRNRMERDGRP